MSGMRSSTRDGQLHLVEVLWAGFCVAMLVAMAAFPYLLTIPYHLIFVTLTLVYGFRLWTPPVITSVLLAITAITGVIFTYTLMLGVTAPDDVAEVPLMPMITGAMAWHAWRRATAQRRVEELAALESSRLDRQREFLRDTSHAIRTPVTIARGHVELLRMGAKDPVVLEDTGVVLHQLDRLHHLAGKLLAIEALSTAESLRRRLIDVGDFTTTVGQRWSQSVQRRWRVDVAAAGTVEADPHRLEEAVDALVENALRFTGTDDTIRISCRADGLWSRIEVADSGPGIPPEDRERVFERFFHRHPPGDEPGTGLGLALVRAVATAHGGTSWLEAAPEGGVLVVLRLRRASPLIVGRPDAGGTLTGSIGPIPTGPAAVLGSGVTTNAMITGTSPAGPAAAGAG